MTHLPQLIQDLAIILVTAAIVSLISKKLRQPVVLGYLVAGFLLSPSVSFMPDVQDLSSIRVWADIGVIILLFGLGLEFSFKKLAQVGRSASVTAVFKILFMILAGFVCGKFLGWSDMDSLFLGGILSISSTAIIVRAFDEMGLKSRQFVPLVFGILVVEDIVAILLLVMLSTVAATRSFGGQELLFSTARLLFFLILWFVLGIYLLPGLMKKIKHWLSDETALVVSLGLCLMMVWLATEAGFSPALGAFVMGSILAETSEGARIEKIIHPVRDLFAAVFFVSVGMLIDPKILIEYRYEIFVITLLTVVGKVFSSIVGALISGNSPKKSVQIGMSLAQIGEFSFIIATLGVSLNVTSSFLYPLAVAVSAITTFLTPYLINFSDPLWYRLEKLTPQPMIGFLDNYRAAVQAQSSPSGAPSLISLLWQNFSWRIILNTTLVFAIFWITHKYGPKTFEFILEDPYFIKLLATFSGLLLASPFLWAVAFGGDEEILNQMSEEDMRRSFKKIMFGVQVGRAYLALGFTVIFINTMISIGSWVGFSVFIVFSLLLFAGGHAQELYAKFENRFKANLTSNNENKKNLPELAPWDAGLAELSLPPYSQLVGKTLMESRLKERFGTTVALVKRGDELVVAPDRNWVLMPYDLLYLIGTDEQIESARQQIEDRSHILASEQNDEAFGLRSILLTEESPLVGKAIRESGLRESISGVIVGLERKGERFLSPDSALILKDQDLLWVVGDLEKIRALRQV